MNPSGKIEQEYPKAWHLLYAKFRGIPDRILEDRTLFDFFDENDLYIKIWLAVLDKDSMTFTWYIFRPGRDIVESSEEYYPNRASAEKDAFEAAFKILEKELS